jgi:hypothetical protein
MKRAKGKAGPGKGITITPSQPDKDWAAREVAYLIGQSLPTVEALTANIVGILNREGISFADWDAKHQGMFEMLRDYSQEQLETEPGPLTVDLTKVQAWLSFANLRAVEAKGFEEKGLSLARLAARKHMSDRAGGDLAKLSCSRLSETRRAWEAIAESLKEKCWSTRALLRPFDAERKAQSS